MKKTIKIIDLLNMISKDEEVPKKINYDGLIYIFDIAENNYISEKADYYDGDYITHKYLTESFEFDILNNEVEILDEEEFEDIEENNDILRFDDLQLPYGCNEEKFMKYIIIYQKKINQLIKNQKILIEKLNKNNNIQ